MAPAPQAAAATPALALANAQPQTQTTGWPQGLQTGLPMQAQQPQALQQSFPLMFMMFLTMLLQMMMSNFNRQAGASSGNPASQQSGSSSPTTESSNGSRSENSHAENLHRGDGGESGAQAQPSASGGASGGASSAPPPAITKESSTSQQNLSSDSQTQAIMQKFGVNQSFAAKGVEVSRDIGMNPEHLFTIMARESGLNPHAQNKASGAAGLIQVTKIVEPRIGYTRDQIAQMPAEEQLDKVVKKYYEPYKGRVGNLESAYMATFAPAHIDKANNNPDAPIYTADTSGKSYTQNKAYDKNSDGAITAREIAEPIRKTAEKHGVAT